jgi:hypothetical protein
MRKSQFRARVEHLERREVLSNVHPAALPDPSLSLRGRGIGSQISRQAIPGGSYQTISDLSGKSLALGGKFTGQLVANYSSSQFRIISGSAVLVGQGGEELLNSVNGTLTVPRHKNAFNTTGTLHFTVVGGTGTFANATGQGQLRVNEDLFSGQMRYSIHGTVHTQ